MREWKTKLISLTAIEIILSGMTIHFLLKKGRIREKGELSFSFLNVSKCIIHVAYCHFVCSTVAFFEKIKFHI